MKTLFLSCILIFSLYGSEEHKEWFFTLHNRAIKKEMKLLQVQQTKLQDGDLLEDERDLLIEQMRTRKKRLRSMKRSSASYSQESGMV